MQNQNQNMSDLIENYLKNVLHKNETVEIGRSEITEPIQLYLPKLIT